MAAVPATGGGMTWVRIDDQFADHPKVVGLSAHAFRLHVTAICYAARQGTDGVIPRGAPFVSAGKRYTAELVDAGLWDAHPGGFLIHDYLEYNPSAEESRSRREAKAIAGAKGAASRWHGDGDGKTMPPTRTRPLPDPEKAAAAAAVARAREERPDEFHRAFEAWERQAPGSYNPTIGDAIGGWLLDGTPIEWIEKACTSAGEEGGRKSVGYVRAIVNRYRAQGSTDDTRAPKQRGTNGRTGDTAEGEHAAAALRDLENSGRDFGERPWDMAAD